MATTTKTFISSDSPQYKEHTATIKFKILQIFFKIYDIYNILLQTIFWTTRLFLMLGVTVPNTINTNKFHPSIIPGSKFKIPSQYFMITFLAFLNFCQLLIFFTRCFACIASPIVSSTH